MFIPKVECTAPLNDYVTQLEDMDLSIFRTRFSSATAGVLTTGCDRASSALNEKSVTRKVLSASGLWERLRSVTKKLRVSKSVTC